MINPMGKITVISLSGETEETVRRLRELGMLHVAMRASDGSGAKSAAVAAKMAAAKQAVAAIEDAGKEFQFDDVAETAAPDGPEEEVAKAVELSSRIKSLQQEVSALQDEMDAQTPYGDFDPESVKKLAGKGIPVTLFRIKKNEGIFPEGGSFVKLGDDGKFAYGAAFTELGDLPGLQKPGMPRYSLSAIKSLIAEKKSCIISDAKALTSMVSRRAEIEEYKKTLETEYEFRRVRESAESHGLVDDICGFCPYDKVPALEDAAKKNGWALWVRDPEEGDDVPVDLKLPRLLRPIKVLFSGLGILPGYRETDVSAVFLAFFSVFFAMIICDAGYGLLMLSAVLFTRFKKPHADSKPFWLFGLFAVCTIIWGVLTGSYFGIDHGVLPKAMQGIPWLGVNSNVMWLCFIIGAVHLTIAHLWNAVAIFPSPKAFAQIGWIGIVWLMFYIAGALVVGRPIPACIPWIGGIGFLLIVIFMTAPKDFKDEWINHPMLLLNLTSCLVDVISYVRLFAVGMASAQIALIFNQMAVGFDLPMWIKPLVVMAVLVLGHGLNLMLGALSILVHAVRLNTLEFSTHKGISWSGQPYAPFGKEKI